MTDVNLERLKKLDCATLSDAMDKLGIEGVCRGIKPRDQKVSMAGRAWSEPETRRTSTPSASLNVSANARRRSPRC